MYMNTGLLLINTHTHIHRYGPCFGALVCIGILKIWASFFSLSLFLVFCLIFVLCFLFSFLSILFNFLAYALSYLFSIMLLPFFIQFPHFTLSLFFCFIFSYYAFYSPSSLLFFFCSMFCLTYSPLYSFLSLSNFTFIHLYIILHFLHHQYLIHS